MKTAMDAKITLDNFFKEGTPKSQFPASAAALDILTDILGETETTHKIVELTFVATLPDGGTRSIFIEALLVPSILKRVVNQPRIAQVKMDGITVYDKEAK